MGCKDTIKLGLKGCEWVECVHHPAEKKVVLEIWNSLAIFKECSTAGQGEELINKDEKAQKG